MLAAMLTAAMLKWASRLRCLVAAAVCSGGARAVLLLLLLLLLCLLLLLLVVVVLLVLVLVVVQLLLLLRDAECGEGIPPWTQPLRHSSSRAERVRLPLPAAHSPPTSCAG